ncbi:MAG: hypothetical protein IJ601_00775 [Acidaminococcaceae bacterium]|nr:hypothetical protein [Acidaminococcaceae bacterium]
MKAYSKYNNRYAKECYDRVNKKTHNSAPCNNENTHNSISYEEDALTLNIPDKDLPSVIGEQVSGLKELKRCVDDAIRYAEDAKNSAETASCWKKNNFLHGLIETKDTKGTLENVQKALQGLAEAQQSAAQAQKVSYQNQEKIGQITRYLFALGASNIAANRSVVNRLKQELEGASASELNEMAKQEIIAVIRQLKAQEDLLNRQNKQADAIRQHDDHLKKLVNDIKELAEKQSNSLTKEKHNNDLNKYDKKLEGLKNLISDAKKDLLDKVEKRQTMENAEQEKQAFINVTENQKKALAEEIRNRNEQIKKLKEQQDQAIQGFDTKLTETTAEQKKALAEEVQKRSEQIKQFAEQQKEVIHGVVSKLTETTEEQKKALAEEVQNRSEQIKQFTEQQKLTLQELEQRNNKNLTDAITCNNEELSKIDNKYNDAVCSLVNSLEEYKKICYKQEHEIEDLKEKLNDLKVLTGNKVEKTTAIGIALLAIIALFVAVTPFIN